MMIPQLRCGTRLKQTEKERCIFKTSYSTTMHCKKVSFRPKRRISRYRKGGWRIREAHKRNERKCRDENKREKLRIARYTRVTYDLVFACKTVFTRLAEHTREYLRDLIEFIVFRAARDRCASRISALIGRKEKREESLRSSQNHPFSFPSSRKLSVAIDG